MSNHSLDIINVLYEKPLTHAKLVKVRKKRFSRTFEHAIKQMRVFTMFIINGQ